MVGEQRDYTAAKLFENWNESFSAYELVICEDGQEDLRIIAANRAFASLIAADYETLPGRLFSDACPMALDWLPLYIQVAKTGKGNMHESYNQDLKKYLSALVFSPRLGEIAILVLDRTHLWQNDQALRARKKELDAIFASMSTGFCIGRILRDVQGKPVDLSLEMVNAAFEILEGYPTATLAGRKLSEIRPDDPDFPKYADVVEQKKKLSFTKQVALNSRILEVICFSQADDTLIFIESDVTEKVRAVKQLQAAYKTIAEQNETILSSIDYASKIQRNLLPKESVFQQIFPDYAILWKPRDVVGGDIYWAKNFEAGTLLCVCDCTGHGTPGALLTMLVVSIFEDTVVEENCADTAHVLYLLDQRMAALLNARTAGTGLLDFHDGCDVAALFIARDGTVTVSSASLPIWVCNGKEARRFKGQRIHIGDGKLTGAQDVQTMVLPYQPENRFYIASDGLYDQIGGTPARPFGYRPIGDLLLRHHGKPLADVTALVWEAFEQYRGGQVRRDDLQLISFQIPEKR